MIWKIVHAGTRTRCRFERSARLDMKRTVSLNDVACQRWCVHGQGIMSQWTCQQCNYMDQSKRNPKPACVKTRSVANEVNPSLIMKNFIFFVKKTMNSARASNIFPKFSRNPIWAHHFEAFSMVITDRVIVKHNSTQRERIDRKCFDASNLNHTYLAQ